jgi:hypothetical protein
MERRKRKMNRKKREKLLIGAIGLFILRGSGRSEID